MSLRLRLTMVAGACFQARHSYEKDGTMRIDEVKKQLEAFGVLGGYREFATSSATVELAAVAAGCEPGRIAKTLSFKTDRKSTRLNSSHRT